ncbi:hypothetical protein MLD38_016568 [Melastoma candidum]|uniref:Uncharacterized protein n=1 Tax=Melastoma candidum TaxID=119954 RepID=A0ACB9QMQ0_9MYRT|nr:hypothetical protein MLD38_016568 [Melastoma candidum]
MFQQHHRCRRDSPASEPRPEEYPRWYSPDTGICRSRHPRVDLPDDPFVDVATYFLTRVHEGKVALVDEGSGESLSYAELHAGIRCLASRLHGMGLSKGDIVLFLLPNSVYYPVVLFGCMYLGAVVTTMNPTSSVAEIKKRVGECGARIAFCSSDRSSDLTSLGISTLAVPSSPVEVDRDGFGGMIFGDAGTLPRPRICQDDMAAIVYSSGTTGTTKGVVLTHRNLIAMIELFARFEASQYEYPAKENVYLAALPMFHIYGLALFTTGLLSMGTTVVVMQRFEPNRAIKAIDRYKVTHFPVVPPILLALTRAKAKGSQGSSLKSLKQVSSGAAPINNSCVKEFVKNFPHVDFIQGYGMTESAAVATRGFNTGSIRWYDSVGLLAPNMEAKVVNWRTQSFLPPGKNGELLLRGPAIMKGYFNNVEATRTAIDEDGWLHTGDIVHFNRDGYLFIVDRLKEIIKYKGFQIAPADLEAVLISHPEIEDVAVTGIQDNECGEIPVAFVVRKSGSLLCEAAIINYLSNQVAPYKKVRKVMFTGSIPRSAAGKILRRELKVHAVSRL